MARSLTQPAARVTGLTLPVSWAEDMTAAVLALAAVMTPGLVLFGAGVAAAVGARWLGRLLRVLRLLRASITSVGRAGLPG